MGTEYVWEDTIWGALLVVVWSGLLTSSFTDDLCSGPVPLDTHFSLHWCSCPFPFCSIRDPNWQFISLWASPTPRKQHSDFSGLWHGPGSSYTKQLFLCSIWVCVEFLLLFQFDLFLVSMLQNKELLDSGYMNSICLSFRLKSYV